MSFTARYGAVTNADMKQGHITTNLEESLKGKHLHEISDWTTVMSHDMGLAAWLNLLFGNASRIH